MEASDRERTMHSRKLEVVRTLVYLYMQHTYGTRVCVCVHTRSHAHICVRVCMQETYLGMQEQIEHFHSL